MTLCDVVCPLHAAGSDSEQQRSAVFDFGEGLPQGFFAMRRVLEIFASGGPRGQLGGLINVGYNCYINSVIQCLAYTPGFATFCMSMPNAMYQCNADGAFFLDSFAHIFHQMSNSKSATPSWFLTDRELLSSCFSGPRQQDAHEFFLALINTFDTECRNALRTKCDNSETFISHLFSSSNTSETFCKKCKTTEKTLVRFSDLEVQIRSFENLQDAVDQMLASQTQRLSRKCDRCNTWLHQHRYVTKMPLILTVTLMRFDEQLRKIDDFFEFPDILEVNDGEIQYQLYAMIVHEGRVINHGHFFAYVRTEEGVWIKANDVCVFKVNLDVVMRSCPYILFYKKLL